MSQKALIKILAVLVIVLGATTIYFATSSQKISITNQKIGENTITEQDLANLKIVLEKEQPEYVSSVKPNYTIEIIRQNGNYIIATLYQNGEFIPSFPAFYALLSQDGWKIIYSGQEVPECSKVYALKFPSDIVTACWDDNKQIER